MNLLHLLQTFSQDIPVLFSSRCEVSCLEPWADQFTDRSHSCRMPWPYHREGPLDVQSNLIYGRCFDCQYLNYPWCPPHLHLNTSHSHPQKVTRVYFAISISYLTHPKAPHLLVSRHRAFFLGSKKALNLEMPESFRLRISTGQSLTWKQKNAMRHAFYRLVSVTLRLTLDGMSSHLHSTYIRSYCIWYVPPPPRTHRSLLVKGILFTVFCECL